MSQQLYILEAVLGPSIPVNRKDVAFTCPKCHHHKKKLQVNISRQFYHCWVCHFKGRSLQTLLANSGMSNVQSYISELNSLSSSISTENFELYISDNPFTVTETHIPIKWPDKCFSVLSKDIFIYKKAVQYLKNRGLTDNDILRYDIKYCEDSDSNMMNRIIIPSYNSNMNLMTYNARSIDMLFPKYREAPHVNKHSFVGFESFINWNMPVVITEGMFDAIAIKHNAIPLFGTYLTSTLKNKIVEHKNIVYICLDPEAYLYGLVIAEQLHNSGVKTYITRLPENKDPSSLGYEKVWKYIMDSDLITSEYIMRNKMMCEFKD